jgi:hypothetical protein
MNAKKLVDANATIDHPYFDKPGEPLLTTGGRLPSKTPARLDWRQAVGVLLIAGGFVTLLVGYAGISGTKNTYDQLTYFLSNGIGGAAAIIVGSTVLVIREHVADRQAIRRIDEQLYQLEGRLQGGGSRREPSNESGAHARSAGFNGSLPVAAPGNHT